MTAARAPLDMTRASAGDLIREAEWHAAAACEHLAESTGRGAAYDAARAAAHAATGSLLLALAQARPVVAAPVVRPRRLDVSADGHVIVAPGAVRFHDTEPTRTAHYIDRSREPRSNAEATRHGVEDLLTFYRRPRERPSYGRAYPFRPRDEQAPRDGAADLAGRAQAEGRVRAPEAPGYDPQGAPA